MKRALTIVCAAVLTAAAHVTAGQEIDPDLVGTWTLSAAEKNVGGGQPTRAPGPRGVLIIDAAGHVFEFFSTTSRNEPEVSQDPERTLANFGGFWGRYAVEGDGRIAFEGLGGVSPSVHGLEFTRTYELAGDRLVITSTDEPQAQGNTRWTWQRVPTVEHLTPAYREVVGFWEHVEEGRLNEATGEVQGTSRRAPSVIVYTPSGFVGVHFPTLGREPFEDPMAPTAQEAQAAVRGYLGYFGTLGVYPGEVSHNLLSGVSPGTGSILRRYADIDGDELIVRLQGGGAQPAGDRPRIVTMVRLRRLSGADEMLPR